MKSRTFFWILLLINLVLAAILGWSLLSPSAPELLPPEEHAEQVLLPGEGEPQASAVPARPEEESPQAEPQTASQPVASVAAAAASEPLAATEPAARQICLRWGDFSPTQWQEARKVLRKELPELEIEESLNEDKAKYWVYMPPYESVEAARQAVADLKAKGVSDTFIIQDEGPQKLAISLGLFTKKTMADEFVARLKAKGVDRIISKPHPQSRYIHILLRGVPETHRADLRALAAGFAKTSVQQVACS